jgi:dethiobiotin synthetase
VQSFDVQDATTDAAILANATGEDSATVCAPHRSYAVALAPPMAADVLKKPRIVLSDLISEIAWHENIDVGVVETVGGPRSPLAHDGDSEEFIRRLQPDRILLIADAALGALNAIRLSLESLGSQNAAVFLNRYDESNQTHRLNRRWLSDHYRIPTCVDCDALTQVLLALPLHA